MEKAESDTDSYTDDMKPPAPKKIKCPKKFVDSWLKDPSFSPWLAKSKGNLYEAKCLPCNKTISPGRSHLIRHSSGKTHLKRMAVAGMETGETTLKSDDNDSGINMHVIKKAELRYVLHIVHHSRSFNSYKHYVPMVHAAHPDCNGISLKKMQLKKSKIAAIIKNVLSKTIVERTIRILKQKMFTILIDESTDVTGTKALCVLVRYVHEGNIQTYLLDYVKMKDASAKSLYKYLKYSLQKYKLSIKNIIGISTDASVMLGKKKSVVALLLKENSNVAVFPCICHNMHLLVSDACKCLPRNLRKLLYKLCTYLSRSPKRQGELGKIQIEMHLAKHRMIQPSRTRWLALCECVHSILEQWAAVIKFFEMEVTGKSDSEMESSMSQSQSESELSDTSDVVQLKKSSLEIVSALRCLYTKAYLEFVDFTLSTITKCNKIFQTSDVLVHNLLEYCHKFLKEIGHNFINYEVIAGASNLLEIDPFKSENLLPLEAMYIGEKAKSTLDEIKQATDTYEQEKITTFLQNCQKFYQTIYKGAIKRLPFNNNLIKALEFLKPSVALDIKKHTGQVDEILNKFESKFDRTACIDEWHALGFLTVREDDMRERLLRLEIVQFWDEINKMCDPGGTKPFINISNLALACLSLSHSNAEIEQFFSLVSEMKTPDRNRLQPEMVAALGRIKLELRNTRMQCSNYIISDDFVQNFNSGMYKKESIPQEFANVIIKSENEFTSESDDCN